MSNVVDVESITKKYNDGFVALDNLDLQVSSGEVVGIIGPNGAGKTTTLKMLSGLIEPTDGYITVDGLNSTNPRMRSNIGFLPEESPAYDSMTAKSYLRHFAELYNVDSDAANKRIKEELDNLHLDKRETNIGDLSKGMTRKVLIALSLVNNPDVLIYDEPASGLDPYTTNFIIDYMEELADRGKSIIFSAHNLYHVESLCDRVIILDKGEVVARGKLEDIRNKYGEVEYEIVFNGPFEDAFKKDGKYRLRAKDEDEVKKIKQKCEEKEQDVVDVYKVENSLENIFLNLVSIRNEY